MLKKFFLVILTFTLFTFNVFAINYEIEITGKNSVYVGEKITLKSELVVLNDMCRDNPSKCGEMERSDASKYTTWSSSNNKIATVSKSGVVSGISAGTVVIKASYKKDGLTENNQKTIVVNKKPESSSKPNNSNSNTNDSSNKPNNNTNTNENTNKPNNNTNTNENSNKPNNSSSNTNNSSSNTNNSSSNTNNSSSNTNNSSSKPNNSSNTNDNSNKPNNTNIIVNNNNTQTVTNENTDNNVNSNKVNQVNNNDTGYSIDKAQIVDVPDTLSGNNYFLTIGGIAILLFSGALVVFYKKKFNNLLIFAKK